MRNSCYLNVKYVVTESSHNDGAYAELIKITLTTLAMLADGFWEL